MSSRKPIASPTTVSGHSLLTRTRQTHIKSLRVPFLTSKTFLNPDEKGRPLVVLPSVFTSYRALAMPISSHKSTLYIMLAYHFILHTHVAPISTSPLPATLCPRYLQRYIYIYIYISSPTLPIASHMNPHRRVCSLICNTPPASAPHFLRGALFTSKSTGRTRPTPPNPFQPPSVWLRCQLHPMKLIFAQCYPITSSCTPSLCLGLP